MSRWQIPPELERWLEWLPLADSVRWASKADGGLYRIRRIGTKGIDYIGQTGTGTMNLRTRLGMLRSGTYAIEMPYTDPHYAGPGLWALRHCEGCDFEAAVTPFAGDVQWRKGLEATAITQHRLEQGVSPTINFGRMPPGYRRSSANNGKLVRANKRFRGGPCEDADDTHLPGIGPLPDIDLPPTDLDWGRLSWSEWGPATPALIPAAAIGLYRMRRPGEEELVYVGQGRILDRLKKHLGKALVPGHPQAAFFAGDLEISFVAGTWQDHQRLEIENDLIAAHVLGLGTVPPAQFLDKR
jgi:hypothetical protein